MYKTHLNFVSGKPPVRRHIVGGTKRTLNSALLPPRLRSHAGDRRLSAGQPYAVIAFVNAH